MNTIAVLFLTLLLVPPDGLDKVDAKAWLNASCLPREDADYVLFFFALQSEQNVQDAVRHVGMLNRLDRDPSVLVLGLTPEPPERVQSFVKKHDVRFAIGAGSRCARRFDVRRPPALIRLKRGEAPGVFSFEEANQLARDVASELRELSKLELQQFVTGDAEGHVRAAAMARLYRKMDKNEYIAFAESRIPEEGNPWVRGRLDYFLHLANGIPRDDDEISDSAYAHNLFEENPDAPEWREVQAYLAKREARKLTVDELRAEYLSHDTTAPHDLVIRRFVTGNLEDAADHAKAKEALMEIIAVDLDPSIRMFAAMGLGKVCATGDNEVADFLQEMAALEENITRVRPMMEYVSHLVRTGLGDPRTMSAPGP
jgi:hypothetical protein